MDNNNQTRYIDLLRILPDGPLTWFWTEDGQARVIDNATNRIVAEMRTFDPFDDQMRALAMVTAHAPLMLNALLNIISAYTIGDHSYLSRSVVSAQMGIDLMLDEFTEKESNESGILEEGKTEGQ